MDSFTIRVESPPKTKGRPRLGRRRKAYTPAETLEAEQVIRNAWLAADAPLFEGPVAVDIAYDKLGQTITVSEYPTRSLMRGDVDNYTKLTLDGLNGVAYGDDRQVQRLVATKS